MKQVIFIKYAELTTKKDNRKMFIDILAKNIRQKLGSINYTLTANKDRMYIETAQIEECIPILKNIFGIHSIVVANQIISDLEAIKENCLAFFESQSFKTFKINTKRSDKHFATPSMEVSRLVGAVILTHIPNIRVDVHNPDILLNIEIHEHNTYLYVLEYIGLGGYPVGVQGKGLLMLSGGIDSPVAGYLALKRGIAIDCLYFESPPHTSLEAKNKVLELTKKLTVYGNDIMLHIVPFTKIQEAIYQKIDPSYMITIMRRMMYRIATIYAKKIKAKAIINGESVGQVASQTLNSMLVINDVTNYPIIRPVCCMDKLEIIELAKKINTFDTSILPYEDCCTIFVPKHPIINPHLTRCMDFEKLFDYRSLIKETISKIEVIVVKNQEEKFQDLL